jgi:hypothetical protein
MEGILLSALFAAELADFRIVAEGCLAELA